MARRIKCLAFDVFDILAALVNISNDCSGNTTMTDDVFSGLHTESALQTDAVTHTQRSSRTHTHTHIHFHYCLWNMSAEVEVKSHQTFILWHHATRTTARRLLDLLPIVLLVNLRDKMYSPVSRNDRDILEATPLPNPPVTTTLKSSKRRVIRLADHAVPH